MRRTLLLTGLLLLAAGCVTSGREGFVYDPAILDGAAVFGETIPAAPAVDVLRVSPEMADFVRESTRGRELPYSRFRHLMASMAKEGFFINQYDRTATFTAAETFEVHRGNCLAYTTMFVALAREAGLDASFQLIRARPTWDVEAGFLIRNNHVNVMVDRVVTPGSSDTELIVDFNNVEVDPDSRRQVISDEYAASLYYANKAVEHLHAKDYPKAFAQMKRAILTYEENSDHWNNLGALYSIVGAHASAEAVYRIAMQIEPRDKTAISGLAKALQAQGRLAEAEQYAALAVRYQNRNPYYHYAVAEQAMQSDAFEAAITSINQAIELKRNNSEFYALRAQAADALGDIALAEQSLKLKRKYNRPRRQSGFDSSRINFN